MKAWKRAAVVFLSALMLLGSGSASAAGGRFSDVPKRHWARESIENCAKYGLMLGIGDGKFGLGLEMSRASYLEALCRLMGWEMLKPEKGSFPDNQKTNKWYYSAVETGYAHGALTRQSRLCRPEDPITREEMAAMSVRALGYTLLAEVVGDGDCPFHDVSTNDSYITMAYRMGIIRGVDEYNFRPKETASREQAAAVLLRLFYLLNDEFRLDYVSAAPDGVEMVPGCVGTEGRVPLSPRAPIENLYALAEKNNLRRVAINAAPFAQNVKNGKISEGHELTQEEFKKELERGKVYRSDRYESSYLIVDERDRSHTVIWFESEEDILAKAQLCRCLGIKELFVVRP